MAPERPSYTLELQYPHKPGHSSIWSEYGTYRSFELGDGEGCAAKAALPYRRNPRRLAIGANPPAPPSSDRGRRA